MTWDTPTPTSASPGVPATKFGIAIGSGVNSPSGMTTRFWAKALPIGPPINRPVEAIPEMICRRLRRNRHVRQSIFVSHGFNLALV